MLYDIIVLKVSTISHITCIHGCDIFCDLVCNYNIMLTLILDLKNTEKENKRKRIK